MARSGSDNGWRGIGAAGARRRAICSSGSWRLPLAWLRGPSEPPLLQKTIVRRLSRQAPPRRLIQPASGCTGRETERGTAVLVAVGTSGDS